MSEKPIKPAWSKSKRLGMTLFLSAVILGTAVIMGGGLYFLGKAAGIFKSQSLKTMTTDALLEDPAFLKALEKVEKTKRCENSDYSLVLEYFEPLEPATSSGTQSCLAFKHASNPDASQPIVEIKPLPTDKNVALGDVFRELANVKTASVPHSRYAITKVVGLRNNLEYWGYVIPISESSTWIVAFSPVTQRAAEAVDHLVSSFQINQSNTELKVD